jgi:hypothetical protein
MKADRDAGQDGPGARNGGCPNEEMDYMPVLSKFYGIVIRMLFARSLDARFHAIYENCELVVGIWPLVVIQGEAPGWVRDKVMAWAREHQSELLEAWRRCQNGLRPVTIAPLN